MPPSKKRRRAGDPLEAYRKIRKPMPPPERVIPDKRRKSEERQVRREAKRQTQEELDP